MSDQEEERTGILAWVAAGVAMLVGALAMALVIIASILRTMTIAPDFSLLSLCLHGAGWEGGVIPGDPGTPGDGDEEGDEEEADEDSDEDEVEGGEPEPGEGDQDDDAEDDESEDEDTDSGDAEGDAPGHWPSPDEDGDDGDDIPSIPRPDDDGEGGEPWWPGGDLPENPEDWAFVVPGQDPGTVVHTVSWTAPAAPAAPAEPSREGLWVPEDMLRLYKKAGEHWDMDWTILASIGYHESRHGTDPNTETENHAGALGPMQFIPSAWEHHGIFPDGRTGTPPLEDRLDPTTAVWSAAHKLTDQGIRTNRKEALHAYNRSWAYVEMVLRDADRFRTGDFTERDGVGVGDIPEGGSTSSDGNIPDGPGSGTEADFENCWDLLSSILDDDAKNRLTGGLVARAPDELTQDVVDWALAQKGKPYIWGGTGPLGYDCSGLTQGAYAAIGLNIPRVTHDQVNFGPTVAESDVQVGDLIFIDTPAGGANVGPPPRHVALVVDAENRLMIEARCTLCGPIDVRSWADSPIYSFTRPLADPSAAPLVERAATD